MPRIMNNKLGLVFKDYYKRTTGTREWCPSNVNIYFGCSNNCTYCYAKRMALRFGRIHSEKEWANMKLNEKAFKKNYRLRKGCIMFPSSHDITPESAQKCSIVLQKLLKAGNRVLITTKPDYEIIKKLCFALLAYKGQVQFRFTITSINNDTLKLYEPNAPDFDSRYNSLRHCYLLNFRTSVSIEPFLDKDPINLIMKMHPYVNKTIWIGIMSGCNYQHHNKYNLRDVINKINRLPENIKKRVRLKDSIRNLGFEII